MTEEKRYQDIVDDEILKAIGLDDAPKQGDPGFWQKHCDRYHPDGIKQDSTCKYLDQYKTSPKPTKEYAQEAQKYAAALQNEFLVRGVRFRTQEDLEDEILDKKVIAAITKYTEPTDDKDYAETLKSAYEVLSDLKKRFPNFSLYYPFLIPAKMKHTDGMGGALSAVDRIETRDTYIVISKKDKIPFTGFCYGHEGDQYFSDRLRHEIGHVLTTPEIAYKFRAITASLIKEKGAESFYDEMERIVSKGSTMGIYEGIAESFSFVTSPAYKRGTIFKGIEELVLKDMLKEGSPKK